MRTGDASGPDEVKPRGTDRRAALRTGGPELKGRPESERTGEKLRPVESREEAPEVLGPFRKFAQLGFRVLGEKDPDHVRSLDALRQDYSSRRPRREQGGCAEAGLLGLRGCARLRVSQMAPGERAGSAGDRSLCPRWAPVARRLGFSLVTAKPPRMSSLSARRWRDGQGMPVAGHPDTGLRVPSMAWAPTVL